MAAPAIAQDDTAQKQALKERLEELVEDAELGSRIGIVVADAVSGGNLFELAAQTPRNPASNMKLVTAATALTELGPDYRMRTTLSGAIDDGGSVDTLVLRGEGDPDLRFEHLSAMTRRLVELGVRRVENIVVDGRFFDSKHLPPAFDQQPGEVAAFRAPVGAVSVDRNSYVLRISPGPAVDAPANVLLRAPGYFELESKVSTSAGGAPNVLADQRGKGDKLRLRLRGSVPIGVRGVSYRRRIDSPLPYAGYALKTALKRQRIRGAQRVRVGKSPGGLKLLANHDSAPVQQHLSRVGKWSDNFVAEMLLKVVGARSTSRPGSSEAGAARSQALLEAAGVEKGAAKIVNGSGLFEGNSIAPDHITRVLVLMYNNPGLRSEYLAQLAVGGSDGTLRSRMKDVKPARIVRAKTGTLNDVIALSGYVLGPRPERAVAFSFLLNGVRGKQYAARRLTDELVKAIARYVWKN